MSTALDWIKSSMRKLGVIAVGESPTAEEANDALMALNQMIGGWSTNKLAVPGIVIEEFSLIAGNGSYTLGDGGDFDTSAPVHIKNVFIQKDLDYPVKIIDSNPWGNISDKTFESSIPTCIYIDKNAPLRNVYLYPVPSEANTIIFHNFRKISSISGLTTEMLLSDGYERAIVNNLAIELAPEYGKTISSEVAKIASESFADIKRANITPREVGVDPALLKAGSFDWRTG